jgi:hypothetical protein
MRTTVEVSTETLQRWHQLAKWARGAKLAVDSQSNLSLLEDDLFAAYVDAVRADLPDTDPPPADRATAPSLPPDEPPPPV